MNAAGRGLVALTLQLEATLRPHPPDMNRIMSPELQVAVDQAFMLIIIDPGDAQARAAHRNAQAAAASADNAVGTISKRTRP
jgi:hypothetical protein